MCLESTHERHQGVCFCFVLTCLCLTEATAWQPLYTFACFRVSDEVRRLAMMQSEENFHKGTRSAAPPTITDISKCRI